MPAKINLIYFSPVFHTRKIGQSIGHALAKLTNAELVEYDVTPYGEYAAITEMPDNKLTIFAAPVYGGRLPGPAVERFGKFRGNGAPAILVVSYGNRAFDDALLEMAQCAKISGFTPVAAAACVAEHTIATKYAHGRPSETDLASLQEFAAEVKTRLDGFAPTDAKNGKLPGNAAFRDFKVFPLPQIVGDNCVHCNICADGCPVAAIDKKDQALVDLSKCICCMRCVNICPVQARHADANFINAVTEKLAPVCATPKENSYFFPEA